jgi:hypothetical protein
VPAPPLAEDAQVCRKHADGKPVDYRSETAERPSSLISANAFGEDKP